MFLNPTKVPRNLDSATPNRQDQAATRVMSFKQAKVICHCCPFSQAPAAAPKHPN